MITTCPRFTYMAVCSNIAFHVGPVAAEFQRIVMYPDGSR
jgi:hypothetical protein